eukprot:5323723-Pyramimonas_sp.AAC.1
MSHGSLFIDGYLGTPRHAHTRLSTQESSTMTGDRAKRLVAPTQEYSKIVSRPPAANTATPI